MRILSYNIWFGGRKREERLAEVIRTNDVDLVLLQEATDAATFDRLRIAAGLPFGASRAGHSLAFMSRAPVRHYDWHKPRQSRHAFLEVVVGDDELRVFGVHLSAVHAAWTERQRMRELQALLGSIERHQHGLHLLVGDFNTLAPGERLDMGKLPLRLHPFVWLSGGRVRWRTVKTILDSGYIDAYRMTHPDVPGMTFPTWDPHVRLDYAFVPGVFAARVRACDVVSTDTARAASDHFPLSIDIDTGTAATREDTTKGRGDEELTHVRTKGTRN